MKLPPVIETARLIIRRHLAEDREPFVQFMTDDEATRYLTFDAEQRTPEGAAKLFDYVLESYNTEDPVFALAIVDKETGAYVGSCGLSTTHRTVGSRFVSRHIAHSSSAATLKHRTHECT